MPVRVKTVRPLIVYDDGETISMVPRGMTGTLVGCERKALTTVSISGVTNACFMVAFDRHAFGESHPASDGETEYGICEGYPVHVPDDAIEVVSIGADKVLPFKQRDGKKDKDKI